MKTAHEKGMFTTYDPNWREGRIRNKKTARRRIKKFFPLASVLKLSSSDAIGITEEKTLSSALKKLPGNTILTRKEKGALFWNGKTAIRVPAQKVKVVDTIGAGDAFSAAIIARYCRLGHDAFWGKMPENLKFAAQIAASVCSARGATSGLRPRRSN